MKISEIRALVAVMAKDFNAGEWPLHRDISQAITALETLLAREAEVLKRCDAVGRISLAGLLADDIRAILNPEGE